MSLHASFCCITDEELEQFHSSFVQNQKDEVGSMEDNHADIMELHSGDEVDNMENAGDIPGTLST
jgi:hypothetical protein